jgi:DeoR/GlpR family transcriptional regulator of sugar metabolism
MVKLMKTNRKVVEDRQQKILNLVRDRDEIRNEELASELGVSLMTVRRDLGLLEQNRLLRRTHGGAISMERAHTTRHISEEAAYCREKISEYAAGFLADGDSIFINGSRMALNMLEHAGEKRITVNTNNGWAIGKRFPKGVTINFTGGEMQGHIMVGEGVVRNLLTMHADKTFLGCAAVYENGEFRYDIWTEISINEIMVSRTTGPLYLLAEHTKLQRQSVSGRTGSGVTYDRPTTLITDSMADPSIVDQLRRNGIEVIMVDV